MRPGATYRPLVNPNPLLSIDMRSGMVRRYVRVQPAAGMRQQAKFTHEWFAAAENGTFNRFDVEFDYELMQQLRLTGKTW